MTSDSSSSPPQLTGVIVDDEPPARSLIREFLDDYDHVEIVGTCSNGRKAVDRIHEAKPALVFLDVQMPGLDGFDVLERLDTVPYIIFSTAYDEYALRAFEAGAVDYLRKPFSRDRFQTAIERVTKRYRQSQADPGVPDAEYVEKMASLLQDVRDAERETAGEETTGAPKQLYVQRGRKIVPVNVASIRWIEAAGDYAKLHTDDGTYVTSVGLGELTSRLPNGRFKRIHRSHVVALPAIDHLRSDGSGGYKVRLDDGTRLRVSRTYAPNIRDRIV